MTITLGKRRDINDNDRDEGLFPLEPGEYGKYIQDDNRWYCRPPDEKFGVGGLGKHQVIEHEDGTITVSPSILFYDKDGSPGWHGYLEHGVWREV